MNTIKTLLTILVISLLSTPSWSATKDDLVQREGLYYKRFTDVPFTGKVTGQEQGSIKNGKREGAWVRYHENGQLGYKENYKNGKLEGAEVWYWDNGQLRHKGNFKNGKKDGYWISYWGNDQLFYKGNYKNGKKEGVWVGGNEDGTVFKPGTGIFKDNVKISN